MSELNYGIDDELKQKQELSYDKFLEKRVVDWIEQITGSTKGRPGGRRVGFTTGRFSASS